MNLPRTGIIRFNLAERGRSVRGPNRNFDLAQAARLINSPFVQEKVKHGDMIGYFGHWPREQFGLNPAEGGVVDGKAVSIEPALRTVSIKAYPDGTVEHEEEFLDTPSGKIAWRLYSSKAGGFSSAIRAPQVGGKAIPSEFHGFDYVLEPNYSTNRGYDLALDGVEGGEVFDAVAERQLILDQCASMLDSMQSAYDQMSATVARLSEENAYYLSALARQGKDATVLDGIMDLTVNPMTSHLDRADEFLTAPLVKLQQPKKAAPEQSQATQRQLSRLGL